MKMNPVKLYTRSFLLGITAGLMVSSSTAQNSPAMSLLSPRVILVKDKRWPVKNDFAVNVLPTPSALSLEVFEHVGNQTIASYKINKTKQLAQLQTRDSRMYRVANRSAQSPQRYVLYRGFIKDGSYPLYLENRGKNSQELELNSFPNNAVSSISFTASLSPTLSQQTQALLGRFEIPKLETNNGFVLSFYNAPTSGIEIISPTKIIYKVLGGKHRWTTFKMDDPAPGTYFIVGSNPKLTSIPVGIRSTIPVQIQSNETQGNVSNERLPIIRVIDTEGQVIENATYEVIHEGQQTFIKPILEPTYELSIINITGQHTNNTNQVGIKGSDGSVEFVAKQVKTAVKINAKLDDCTSIKSIQSEIEFNNLRTALPNKVYLAPTELRIPTNQLSSDISSEQIQTQLSLGKPVSLEVLYKAKPQFFINAPKFMQLKDSFFVDVVVDLDNPFPWQPKLFASSPNLEKLNEIVQQTAKNRFVFTYLFKAKQPGDAVIHFEAPNKRTECSPPPATIRITPNIR
jgi:hypothetical protein